MDGTGVLRPLWELVGIGGKGSFQLIDWLWVFEEEDLSEYPANVSPLVISMVFFTD